MPLNEMQIYNILRDKGCTGLYHANTALTSLTFIEEGGLLSRGAVEENQLKQTPQNTDSKDKKYNVWFDIFFDAVDIHARTKDINYYGPISFVFDLELLNDDINCLEIIKSNPKHWSDATTQDEKYYKDETDFDSKYILGDFNTMITFTGCRDRLSFNPFLREIVIDNVMAESGGPTDSEVVLEKFKKTAKKNCPEVEHKIRLRECGSECGCFDRHHSMDAYWRRRRFGF